ncbi:Uracil-DNA glycosylase, partial [Dysosmobacter welbionis]
YLSSSKTSCAVRWPAYTFLRGSSGAGSQRSNSIGFISYSFRFLYPSALLKPLCSRRSVR